MNETGTAAKARLLGKCSPIGVSRIFLQKAQKFVWGSVQVDCLSSRREMRRRGKWP